MHEELKSAERQNAAHLKESSSRRIDLNERDDRCCIAPHTKFKSYLLPPGELMFILIREFLGVQRWLVCLKYYLYKDRHFTRCVCVCVCVHVYVVYEDTNLYNDMGMT